MKRFRVILEETDRHSPTEPIIRYLKTSLTLDDPHIARLLAQPPGILIIDTSLELIDRHLISLNRLGCRLRVEPVLAHPQLPFAITEADEKVIKKELSKIRRVQVESVIFLAELIPVAADFLPPSLLGPVRDDIEACFRDSDTVIGIDERRIIVMCFATGYRGGAVVAKIISKTIHDLFVEKVKISVGYAVFPEHGATVFDLLLYAEQNKRDIQGDAACKPEGLTVGHNPFTLLKNCFIKARGRLFERLIAMDVDTLWIGLSLLSKPEQFEFLARMPYDWPDIQRLKNMIQKGETNIAVEAQNRLEMVLHQLEFEEKMRNLEEIQSNVLDNLNRINNLPMMPAIATKIFKMINTPESSVDDLADVIESDRLLTSKLLRTANSAFYGSMNRINSVKQAVMLLGMDKIMDLAFGLAAARIFDIKIENPIIDPKIIWNHSVVIALIVQDLCEKLPQYNMLGGFTAGLLHDIGKIFFLQQFPEQYLQMIKQTGGLCPIFELEEERFGINHAATGRHILRQWGLPEPIVQAVAFHHHPHLATTQSEMAAIIGLADYLYYMDFTPAAANHASGVHAMRISYGHSLYLKTLFPDITKEGLNHIAARIRESIRADQKLITILGRGVKHDSALFG